MNNATPAPRSGNTQTHGLARVFDEMPELLHGLPSAQAAEARRVPVRTITLSLGGWASPPAGAPGHLGLLVLDGLLSRSVSLATGTGFAELLGAGDLLRPWAPHGGEHASVRAEARWDVLRSTRLAVLDRRFALAVARWPEITGAIIERAAERSRSLVFQLAVCHLKRVESRVLAALWHAADRWGRVTREGVVVPLPLTHKLLASMVGAHRPSVTTALGTLRDRGVLRRRADGAWLLTGDPPRDLANLREVASLPPTARS